VHRQNFAPYETAFNLDEALQEATRCLHYGLGAEVTGQCSSCLTCLRSCPYEVPVMNGAAAIPVENCQACGFCTAVCPAKAISIQGLPKEKIKPARRSRFSTGRFHLS